MNAPDFPRHDLPPLRHQQARALLVREVGEHPSSRSLRLRSRRGVPRRFAMPATAMAVVLAVVGAGVGAHLLRNRPAAEADAAMQRHATPSAGRPAGASAAPLPAPGATYAASTPDSASVPDFPRSISAARNATLTAVSQDSRYVELFETGGSAPKRLARFDARDAWTAAVALNPAGTLLATSGARGTVRIWDVSTPSRPRLTQTLAHHTEYVPDLEFSPDGTWLVTAGYDNQARLWRVSGGTVRPAATLPADTDVMAVAFDLTARYLATATYDQVTLWDLRAGGDGPRRLSTLRTDTDGQIDLSFSADSRTLAVGTHDVTLWDLADPRVPAQGATLTGTGPAAAFALQWDYLATTDAQGHLELWKVTGAAHAELFSRPAATELRESDGRTLAWAADGRTLGFTAMTGDGVTLGEIAVPIS